MLQLQLIVSLLSLSNLCLAQTIIVDDVAIDANASTVSPAAAVVPGDLPGEESIQLTDTVLSNLTDLSLTNISLFSFADTPGTERRAVASNQCKTYPGDTLWPSNLIWDVLNLLTGGALIKTVPIGAHCYDSWGYNAAECAYVTDNFSNSTLHGEDPTSSAYPLYEGLTCQPTTNETGNCTVGGFPSYVINVTSVAQIQLGVNFARNLNLRLVIKNTGHDFNGRSVGHGALSIWTHHLKNIIFYDDYTTSSYSGPALKVSAGVVGFELFEAAEKYNVTAVGGEGRTVGYAGGYLAGGGHSPLSPIYGMGADQVLSVNVVTPDGRFVTADEDNNTDLFWALRGGGGSSYGVVTSYTVKVYPKLPVVSVMTFSFASGGNVTKDAFWRGVKAYLGSVPTYTNAGNYEYWNIYNVGTELLFSMVPWFAPNMTNAELKALTAPLFATFANLGLNVTPVYSEHDSYLPAWSAGFPQEAVGSSTGKTAARLFPKANLEDPAKFNASFNAIRSVVDKGGDVLGFGISGGPGPYPDNAVNPAWREAGLHVISFIVWAAGTSLEEAAVLSKKLTFDWMQSWRDVTPGSGAYASEGDVLEPDFQQSFYGADKYTRLYDFKQQIDPTGLLYANKAVGSEDWYITGQIDGLPTQNGRLCRV